MRIANISVYKDRLPFLEFNNTDLVLIIIILFVFIFTFTFIFALDNYNNHSSAKMKINPAQYIALLSFFGMAIALPTEPALCKL